MSDHQLSSEFKWRVPNAGFEWAWSASGRFRLLVEIDDDDDGRTEDNPDPGRTTSPLTETPQLYLDFASLDPNRKAIMSFANQYGLLVGRPVPTRNGDRRRGDRYSLWKKEIAALNQVIEIWDAIYARRCQDLPELIGMRDMRNGARIRKGLLAKWDLMWKSAGALNQTGQDIPTNIPASESFDPIAEGLAFILFQCNKRLDKHTAGRLLYNPGIKLPSPLKNTVPRMGRPVSRFVPKNLLGALWVQAAEAIGGTREHRPCKGCGRRIAISPDDRPRHAMFCTQACKAKSQRAKRRHARELHVEGVNLEEIARRLNTEPERVRKWIKGEGRAQKQ